MIKKIICIMAVLFFMTVPFASAENSFKTHTFEDNNFSIDLPSDWVTVTKDTPETDTAFIEDGLEYSRVQREFSNNDLIVCGYSKDLPFEVNLFSWEDEDSQFLNNFNYKKTEYENWKSSVIGNLENSENEINRAVETRSTSQAKYFVFKTTYKKTGGECLSAITVVNGVYYRIDLYLYSEKLSQEHIDFFNKTLDNFKYLKVDKKRFDFNTVVFMIPLAIPIIILFMILFFIIKRISKRTKNKVKKQKEKIKDNDKYPSSPDL